ncbi:sugar ABC transporter substrate-binding protein [Trujillonella humicola]|uniref:sugar ABC transporter substrate-binding protein n=1 Tax=Trujillonella humicola TaxID=3383699 RepID=UPI003905FC9F
MRSRRSTISTIIAIAALTTATACSQPNDDDGGGGGGGGGGNGGGGNAAAEEEVQQYLSPPEGIPLDEPLAACPEEGRTIVVTENPQAVTRKTNDGLDAGAELLGWTVIREPVGTGPEDPQRAFDAALDRNPDAVLVSGNPSSTFRSQLERANAAGIPVLISDNGEPVGVDGTTYTIGLDDFAQTGLWGRMNALYAASQGAEHVLVVNLSIYPILNAWAEGVEETMAEVAPDTAVTTIDPQVSDLVGGNIPSLIVSEIQRNPDIDWVLLALGDMTTGLDAALRAASITDVNIGGESASTANIEALRGGTEDAWTGFAAEIHGMYRIDALARIFAGEDPTGIEAYSELPTQLITPDNVGDAPLDDEGYYVGVPDYRDHFEQNWRANC